MTHVVAAISCWGLKGTQGAPGSDGPSSQSSNTAYPRANLFLKFLRGGNCQFLFPHPEQNFHLAYLMENCKHGLQEQKQGEQVLRKSAGKRSLWLETKERVLVSWGMTGSTNERKTKRKKAFHSRYFHMIKMQLDSLRWPISFRLFNIIPSHLLLGVSYLVLSFCVIMILCVLRIPSRVALANTLSA